MRILSVPAATITLTVRDSAAVNGRKTAVIDAVARTSAWASRFYFLENRYTTVVDVESGRPIQYAKNIRQKSIEQVMSVQYREVDRTALYEGGKFDGLQIQTLENPHNLFSMLYLLRRPLNVDQSLVANLDVETEPWKALMQVIAREQLSVSGRNYDTHRIAITFMPMAEEKKRKKTDILTRRLFRSESRLILWMDAVPPYAFLRLEIESSSFTTVTELEQKP